MKAAMQSRTSTRLCAVQPVQNDLQPRNVPRADSSTGGEARAYSVNFRTAERFGLVEVKDVPVVLV